MSNAILHSSQYQNYRRIDLIVIHCSATRATQRYTVTTAVVTTVPVALPTSVITTTSLATGWFMPVARCIR